MTSKQAAKVPKRYKAAILDAKTPSKVNAPKSDNKPVISQINSKAGWFYHCSGKPIYMRSQMEMNFAHYLNYLQDECYIQFWYYEPDTFWFEGIKRGVTNYKPDFKVFMYDGSVMYYEVKGYMDAKSLTKLKRMKKYHPHITVQVIGTKEFKPIKMQAFKIPNWGKWLTENPNPKK